MLLSGFKKLYEDKLDAKESRGSIKNAIRKCFGCRIDEDRQLVKDDSEQVCDPKNICIQEMAYEFLGRNYKDILEDRQEMLKEADGGIVSPSTFSDINGFSATMFGLLDSLVLKGYENPKFLADDFVDVQSTRTNGGKNIRTYMDSIGTSLTDAPAGLLPLEEAPSVGEKEGFVVRPTNIRDGLKVMVSLEAILYDHSDTVQQSAVDSGEKIAYLRELRVARMVLGVDNTYNRDGVTGNTYLSTKGTTVMNYKNSDVFASGLTSWEDIQTILSTLAANINPYTGMPIAVNMADAMVWTPISKLLTSKVILRATDVLYNQNNLGGGSTWPKDQLRAQNPLDNYGIAASPIWDKVVSDAESTAAFLFGEPKKAFAERVLIPFSSVSVPLGPREVTSNVAFCQYVQRIAVPMVTEPRYMYLATVS